MHSPKDILLEMEKVLDQLIENAERLHELSKKMILEDEVDALQYAQNEMLTKLTDLDSEKDKCLGFIDEVTESIQERVDRKIDIFQNLNDRFIDNLSAQHPLFYPKDDSITEMDDEEDK